MKQKNVLIFVTIIIILIGACIALNTRKKDKNFSLEKISNIEYMLFYDSNKYGVVNKSGKIIINAEYDEIDIPNPTKPLFICKYNYNSDTQDYSIKVLNEKNEPILYEYYIVDSIKLNWDNSEVPFEKSVLKFKQKGKYGLIDFSGKVILKAKYDEIESLDFQEGLF